MTSKERMMIALHREVPDRLPATVHQWQPCHLDKYLDGIDALAAFRRFGLDAAITSFPVIEPDSPDWQTEITESQNPDGQRVQQINYHTPEGILSTTLEWSPETFWKREHLVKRPEDVELIDRYMPIPRLDKDALTREYDQVGTDGIVRGFVWGDQGGCWQNACEFFGLENLIMATFDDPGWVHYFLRVLQNKKMRFIEESLADAKYDLIETGGGASSSTCVSPDIHAEFCLPYDREQHDALHRLGFPCVYHTCGGMMPILELIVANQCDASETLTPPGMGGDAIPAQIKERIGNQVCLIGGLNQFQVLDIGTAADIRDEVNRLFAALGPRGGYMISPSDHFFETPVANLQTYADAARECRY